MQEKTWTFYVAGVQHHKLKTVIDKLSINDRLLLVPEPTNKYDCNAVKITYNGFMLGYVPAKFSPEVTAEFSLVDVLICEITDLQPTKKPWEQLKVTIRADNN